MWNYMAEKSHLPLGSDSVMKYNQHFVGEILNCWVCVSGKLAVFQFYDVKDFSLSQDTFQQGRGKYVLLAA